MAIPNERGTVDDPAGDGTWTATNSLTIGRREHTATLLNNGMVSRCRRL